MRETTITLYPLHALHIAIWHIFFIDRTRIEILFSHHLLAAVLIIILNQRRSFSNLGCWLLALSYLLKLAGWVRYFWLLLFNSRHDYIYVIFKLLDRPLGAVSIDDRKFLVSLRWTGAFAFNAVGASLLTCCNRHLLHRRGVLCRTAVETLFTRVYFRSPLILSANYWCIVFGAFYTIIWIRVQETLGFDRI